METADVPPRVRRAMAAHAAEEPGREACGLLIGSRAGDRIRVDEIVRCENRAPPGERGHRFELDPLRVLREERARRAEGHAVVGFYHSHPRGGPRPSSEDRTYMAYWPKTLWLILAPGEGDAPFDAPRLRGWTTTRYGNGESVREVSLTEA